jgi:hypothetical protein
VTIKRGRANVRRRNPFRVPGALQESRIHGRCEIAGFVVARVPVILTSRADTATARRFSAAAAVLYADALTRDPAILLPETAE